ncbi:MAG: cytochrome c oxidase subunit 3 [Bacteroidales bacterium]|nr:cytochrome c oxidase subunit 3 [Bacteroidales bacterium]
MTGPDLREEKSFLYPPGGILIWIIVLVELLTFGIALIVFRVNFHQHYDVFLSSQNMLSKNVGLFNTIILITSGYFMATAMINIKRAKQKNAVRWLLFTILTGVLFLIVKTWEYSIKITEGHGFGFDSFFDFYWMLTLFHFIHVLVGLLILTVLLYKLQKGHYHSGNYLDVESGGVFWHMCDLIWILLFPVLYLLH